MTMAADLFGKASGASSPGWLPILSGCRSTAPQPDSDFAQHEQQEAAISNSLMMTLLLVSVTAPSYWYVRTPLMAAAFIGMLKPESRRSAYLWLFVSATMFASNYHHWFEADNHKHLLAYWCLAISLSLEARNVHKTLASNARRLLAGTFALATFWKLYSPDFSNGAFFEYTLLVDPRFQAVGTWLGSISEQAQQSNRAALSLLQLGSDAPANISLRTTDQVHHLSTMLTAWTIVIEASVSAAFLLPLRRIVWARDLLLMLFVVTTYAVAPVLGFAYLLLAMGAMSAGGARKRTQVAYVAVFVLVSTYSAPWGPVLQSIGSPS
jgi:hypothetical protein